MGTGQCGDAGRTTRAASAPATPRVRSARMTLAGWWKYVWAPPAAAPEPTASDAGTAVAGIPGSEAMLVAALLNGEEYELALRGLATRLLGRLAERARHFPYPPCWAVRDAAVLGRAIQRPNHRIGVHNPSQLQYVTKSVLHDDVKSPSGSMAFAVAGKTFSWASTLGERLGGGVIGCPIRLRPARANCNGSTTPS